MDDPVPGALPVAAWSTRVGAWLIDVVLVAAVVAVLGDLLGLGPNLARVASPLDIGEGGLLLFVYWTLFEATTGQSPGKLALDLRVVGADGHPPSPARAAIQSFGKAFLLPLDVLIGVLAMRREGRRLFNRLSGTWVVSVRGTRGQRRGPTAVDA